MRRIVLYTLAMAFIGAPTAFGEQSYGYGFLGGTFGGRGGMSDAFRFGIGGEAALAPRLNFGGEIGGVAKNGTGVLASGNLSFYIPTDSAKLDPFVTGGLSLGRKYGETGVWINLGGGVNYWMQRRLGVRAEFRGYPGGYDLNSFAEFRLGVVFR